MPRAARPAGEVRLGHRGLGDDQGVGIDRAQPPSSVERTTRDAVRQPRTQADRHRPGRPPARIARAEGPSAALWESPPPTTGAAVRIVTSWPCSARWSAVPRPRQSPRSSRTRTRWPSDGRAVEHVMDREDVARVDPGKPIHQRQRPLEPGPRRPRSGGDYDRVGARGGDLGRAGVDAEPHVHPERGQPTDVPVEQVQDLAARRLQPGEPELPAQGVVAFQERHRVARARPRCGPPPAQPARRPPPALAERLPPARIGRRPSRTRARPTG